MRAWMLFRYHGLTNLCILFTLFHSQEGFSESKSGSLFIAHNNFNMARSTMSSPASKNVCINLYYSHQRSKICWKIQQDNRIHVSCRIHSDQWPGKTQVEFTCRRTIRKIFKPYHNRRKSTPGVLLVSVVLTLNIFHTLF